MTFALTVPLKDAKNKHIGNWNHQRLSNQPVPLNNKKYVNRRRHRTFIEHTLKESTEKNNLTCIMIVAVLQKLQEKGVGSIVTS